MTIKAPSQGLYRDRGSKFIAYAYPVKDVEDFENQLQPIKKEHPKARHFCFAYVLDPVAETYRYSDDGEPGGSAGLPIYNQLRSSQLHHIAVVVVRYFGGKKLGVPGLINAYKVSTQEALDNAKVFKKFLTDEFKISYTFDQTGPVMRVLNEMELNILENGFEVSPFVRVSIRKSRSEHLKTKLLSLLLKRDEEDITGEEEIEGFNIQTL